MADYTLSAKITADASDFKNKVDGVVDKIKGLTTDTDKFNEKVKQIGGLVAGAFAVDKIIGFTKGVVETTATLNAMEAQFDQVFQGTDNIVALNNLAIASDELGIHVNRLKEGYNMFGAQVKGAGMVGVKAMNATDQATRLAADAAAFYDKSLENTSASLSSFMKGNFQAGDAIGVFTNAKQMDVKANKMLNKSWADLTEAERQWLLLDTVEKTYQLNGAMGQAKRESGEYENVMGNLKATWEKFQQVIGQPILNMTLGVMKAFTGVIGGVTKGMELLNSFFEKHQTLAKIVSVAVNSIVVAMVGYNLGVLGAVAAEKLHIIEKTKKIALDTADYIGIIALIAAEKAAVLGKYAHTVAIKAYSVATGIATTATTALGAAFAFITSPIGLAVAAITAVIGVGVALVKNWDTVKATLGKLGDFFGQTFGKIVDIVRNSFSSVIKFLDDLTGGFFTAGANLIKNLWEGVKSIWADFKAWMAEKIGWLLETLGIWEKGASKIAQSQAQIQSYSMTIGSKTNDMGQKTKTIGSKQYVEVGYKPEKGGKQFNGVWYQQIDGSHAGGLARVPFDGYRAILHKNEAVFPAKFNPFSPSFKAPNIGNLLGGIDFGNLKGMGNIFNIDFHVKLDEISEVSQVMGMINNIPQVANAGMVIG